MEPTLCRYLQVESEDGVVVVVVVVEVHLHGGWRAVGLCSPSSHCLWFGSGL